MFLDHHRVAVICACVLAMAAMGWQATRFAENRRVGIQAALRDPPAFDGQSVLLMMWTVDAVQPTGWVAEKYGQTITVIADNDGLLPGQTVTARGTFRAAGPQVVATWQQVHRWRPAKEALGVLGVVLALFALPGSFRLQEGRVVERG